MQIPGFIDLQVNGYRGIDFSAEDLTKETFIDACQALVRSGTFGFLPTIISAPQRIYQKNLILMRQVIENHEIGRHI